jgi:anti-anti-sigma factor
VTDRTYDRVPGLEEVKTSSTSFPAVTTSAACTSGAAEPPIDIHSEWRRGDLVVVSVTGEVDAYHAGALRLELLSVVASGARVVVVDLDATTFIDSVTLGVLLATLRRVQSRGGELRVACADGPIRRTFELTQLVQVLRVYGNLAEALSDAPGSA